MAHKRRAAKVSKPVTPVAPLAPGTRPNRLRIFVGLVVLLAALGVWKFVIRSVHATKMAATPVAAQLTTGNRTTGTNRATGRRGHYVRAYHRE